MAIKLIIEGNSVYEIDEDCLNHQKKKFSFTEGRRNGGRTKQDPTEPVIRQKDTPS